MGTQVFVVAGDFWPRVLRHRDDERTSSRNDLARFGSECFAQSPPGDVMIVRGRVSRKMAQVLRRIYDQMPEPKWVISMGACCDVGRSLR